MSDLLTRPSRTSTESDHPRQSTQLDRLRARLRRLVDRRPARSAWAGGLIAGCLAALTSAVVCIVLVALGVSSSSGARAGLLTWLVGHGAGLRTSAADVTAVPLGLTLLLCCWAGVWARRVRVGTRWRAGWSPASTSELACAVLTFALGYAAVVAGSTGLAAALGSDVHGARASLVAAGLAAVASALGLSGPRTMADRARCILPFGVLAVLRGAAAGCLLMLLSTVLVLLAAVLTSAGRFLDLTQALELAWPGALMLFATFVLALPNLLGLTGAVLIGPGFALGSGTTVTATSVSLGVVPGWPPLAALPSDGHPPDWAIALLVAPVVAGVAAGWLGASSSIGNSWQRLATALGAGVLAGTGVGSWVLASGGAVGPGRMADLGAADACLPVAVLTLGAGALIGGCAQLVVDRRH